MPNDNKIHKRDAKIQKNDYFKDNFNIFARKLSDT